MAWTLVRLFPACFNLSGFSQPPSALSARLRAGCRCPLHVTLLRPLSSPLLPRPSSGFSLCARRPGCAAILCEFPTAAGAGQLGHLGQARQSARLRSPFSPLPGFFLTIPLLALLFPLPLRLLRCARRAPITPNHPPVSVSPGSQAPGARACVCACVCGGRGPLAPMRVPRP